MSRLSLAAVLVAPVALYAGTVTLPNTFSNGTVADADAVNANFAAVKAAIDDNAATIAALDGSVLQNSVVVHTDPYTTSSCNNDETVFSTTFTPAAAGSTVVVELNAHMYCSNASGADPHTSCYLRAKDGGTTIVDIEYFAANAHVTRTITTGSKGVIYPTSTDPITLDITLHGRCGYSTASLAGFPVFVEFTEYAP
jgi:hypothetical protein